MCVHIGLAIFLVLVVALLTFFRCFLGDSPHGALLVELLQSLEAQTVPTTNDFSPCSPLYFHFSSKA